MALVPSRIHRPVVTPLAMVSIIVALAALGRLTANEMEVACGAIVALAKFSPQQRRRN